jgi:hypothetical protein
MMLPSSCPAAAHLFLPQTSLAGTRFASLYLEKCA